MHDALAYDLVDTVVIDEEDLPQPPALPRVPTKDLAVHVLVEGFYHRRHPSLGKTSCGRYSFHSEFCPVRREMLVHPLSRDCGCFTREELREADDVARKEREKAL